MKPIVFKDVFQTYNGQSGCMCGCRGKYTLPTHTSIEEANRVAGWAASNEKDVSDRRVKIAVTKVNKALAEYSDRMVNGEFEDGDFTLGRNDQYAYIDDGSRTTVVYFS